MAQLDSTAREDPLLPSHIIAAERLDPLPVHEADRRDFRTICNMTDDEVVCTRARRDSEVLASLTVAGIRGRLCSAIGYIRF